VSSAVNPQKISDIFPSIQQSTGGAPLTLTRESTLAKSQPIFPGLIDDPADVEIIVKDLLLPVWYVS